MIKKFLILSCIFYTTLAVQAYEDCILFADGKLTDIKIEDNSIVDISPLITVSNDKNTYIIHPLKSGETKICVLRNDANLIDFDIKVTENKTSISEAEGIEVLTLDVPEAEIEIDAPPLMLKGESDG